jgi:hypothetical protein
MCDSGNFKSPFLSSVKNVVLRNAVENKAIRFEDWRECIFHLLPWVVVMVVVQLLFLASRTSPLGFDV